MIETNVLGDLWIATLVRPNVKYHVGTYRSETDAVDALTNAERIFDGDTLDVLPVSELPPKLK